MVKILAILLLASSCFGQAFRHQDTPWVGVVGAPVSANAALNNGLVAYWKFDEQITSGSRADSVDSHATTDHGSTAFTNGIIGKAMRSVSSSWQSAADHADFGGGVSYSIQLWFYIPGPSLPGDNCPLIAKWGDSGQSEWIYLYLSGVFSWLVQKLDNSGSQAIHSVINPTVNVWHQICMGVDTTNQVIWLQLDNATRVTGAYTTAPRDATDPIAWFQYSSGSGGTFFPGYLDECAYWKRVLTTSEVSTLYNSGNGLTYPY